MLRAITIICLLALGAPAQADSCDQFAKATGGGIAAHWPDAEFVVYENADSEAIENGLRRVGGRVSDAVRSFIVISRPEWSTVRVVGFIDGCYEAYVDVTRYELDLWLAGTGAAQ